MCQLPSQAKQTWGIDLLQIIIDLDNEKDKN